MLRNNQQNAIQVSLNNDFDSGVHFHATGTGKSWIALELILEYQKKKPNCIIFWVCERKSILTEQFSIKKIKERGYGDIYKKFLILNYTDYKQKDWYNSINISHFWSKSRLIIINRSFLTSNDNYKNIKVPIHLIIHDECHTITNISTKKFYQFINNTNPLCKILGFSATPCLDFPPFQKILSSYSIYDAYKDNVIVKPIIHWFKSDDNITKINVIKNVYELIKTLEYKKIIIWAGMINSCVEYANEWKPYFPDFLICVDTSKENINNQYATFEEFDNITHNGLLFCASKHREGSDIKNLDGCIFLDFVQNRYSKTFVQCIGRVLRKDTEDKKKFGLIIDIKAQSSTKIIDKMIHYLNIPSNIFPWNYEYILDKKTNVVINTLELLQEDNISHKNLIKLNETNYTKIYTQKNLQDLFIRPIPNDKKYIERVKIELLLLEEKQLIGYILQALDILHLTKNMPHITRGSCGSSLVCYLLGISHVDPVKYNIKFSRFLNIYRNTLPDIDYDFPYNMRDEVFLKLNIKWPGKIARISNHVYYHEKSAKREGLRKIGIKGFISKYDIHNIIERLSSQKKLLLNKEIKNLNGTFKCYSLHCGGIVYYPEGVPNELKLNYVKENHEIKNSSQIILNKIDISKNKQFKIDILSSRALSQLYETLNTLSINFEENYEDEKTKLLLSSGNNIGLTFAESPLIRKTFMKIRPKTVEEIAICLSIIRPAAKDARNYTSLEDLRQQFIFDDDAIDIIQKSLDCTEDKADQYRRGFASNNEELIAEATIELSYKNESLKKQTLKKLKNLRKYSFCKSHAYSYAQLIWQLAYVKAHKPIEFWKATLNHCHSSYKKWVHMYEARCVGINYHDILHNKEDLSVYIKNRQKNFYELNHLEQLQAYGYWDMKNDSFFNNCYLERVENEIYKIRGIIASSRLLSKGKTKSIVLFIGYDKQKYCEIVIPHNPYFNGQKVGVTCNCKLKDEKEWSFETISYSFF